MLQSANSKKFRTLLKNNYYCDQNQRQTTLITLICITFPDLNHHSAFGWNIATPRVWRVSVGVMMSNLVQIREKSTKINKPEGADNVSIPILYIHRNRPSALSVLSFHFLPTILWFLHGSPGNYLCAPIQRIRGVCLSVCLSNW